MLYILIHHIDDIASYLAIYQNIVNGISISDRSFAEMTFLKPVFCAVASVGLHISNIITLPFQALLAANETNYSTLLSAFPILHDELKSVIQNVFAPQKIRCFILFLKPYLTIWPRTLETLYFFLLPLQFQNASQR